MNKHNKIQEELSNRSNPFNKLNRILVVTPSKTMNKSLHSMWKINKKQSNSLKYNPLPKPQNSLNNSSKSMLRSN